MAVNHEELVLAFGILGNIISCFVYLAPTRTFYSIYKNKSTGEYGSLPYVVALFSSMLWLYYGILKTYGALLVTINSIGCFVESLYIIVYIRYANTNSRNTTIRALVGLNVGCFALIFLVTQNIFVDPVLRFQILGWICVCVSACVFAAPLSILKQVIRTESVESIPICLSCALTLSAVIWFLYGLFLKDKYIAMPNIAGFLLGVIQIMLYVVYKNKKVRDLLCCA